MEKSNTTPIDEIEKWYIEGKITKSQYKRIKKDYLVEEKGGLKYAHTILIGTGFLILLIPIIIFILQIWWELSIEERITFLFASGFPSIFFGYVLWNKSDFLKLSRGLLCLGMFLIFSGFGLTGWDVDRDIRGLFGIILVIIPITGIFFGIIKNSESVSVVSLLLFIWGLSWAWPFLEIKYSILDFSNFIVGLLILFAILLNIFWRLGYYKQALIWYGEHEDAIKSLWLTGIILLVPWIFFNPYLGPIISKSIILTVMSFLCIFYAIKTDYRGLLDTGCIILIITCWIYGIFGGMGGILIASFFTAIILIGLGQGLSHLAKKSSKKEKN